MVRRGKGQTDEKLEGKIAVVTVGNIEIGLATRKAVAGGRAHGCKQWP
jgi:hypothetical protein